MHLCRSYKSFLWKAVTLRITQLSTWIMLHRLHCLHHLHLKGCWAQWKDDLGASPWKWIFMQFSRGGSPASWEGLPEKNLTWDFFKTRLRILTWRRVAEKWIFIHFLQHNYTFWGKRQVQEVQEVQEVQAIMVLTRHRRKEVARGANWHFLTAKKLSEISQLQNKCANFATGFRITLKA